MIRLEQLSRSVVFVCQVRIAILLFLFYLVDGLYKIHEIGQGRTSYFK